MSKKLAKQGFTLIELLVVVLIIGILASVALPQYKDAVEKSRAAKVWPILKAINEAEQRKNMEEDTEGKAYPLADLDLGFEDIHPNNDGSGNTKNYILTPDFEIGLAVYAFDGLATTNEPAVASRLGSNGENRYVLAIRNGKKTCAGGDICKKIAGKNVESVGMGGFCLTGYPTCFTE